MKTQVQCGSCGKHNDASRLFCTHCASKLDLSKVQLGTGEPTPLRHGLRRLLRATVWLALLLVLGLLVWPPELQGTVGDEAAAQSCFNKLADLYELIEFGGRGSRVFSEQETNAYLAELQTEAEPPLQGSALNLTLDIIRLHLQDDQVVVQVHARWRFITLAHTLTGTPRIADGRFMLDVQHAALGRLPMVGPFQSMVVDRVVPVFAAMAREQQVLDNLSRIELREGAARLTVGDNAADATQP